MLGSAVAKWSMTMQSNGKVSGLEPRGLKILMIQFWFILKPVSHMLARDTSRFD